MRRFHPVLLACTQWLLSSWSPSCVLFARALTVAPSKPLLLQSRHHVPRHATPLFSSPINYGRRPRLPQSTRHKLVPAWQLSATAAPIDEAVVDTSASSTASIDAPTDAGTQEDDPFALLSALAATTLLQSDRRRDAVGKETGAQASSATNWIDEGSAFALRNALDKLKLYLPGEDDVPSSSGKAGRERRDEAITWLRWMRSVPRPIIVNLSSEARAAANETVSDDFLKLLNSGGTIGNGDGTAATIGPSKMQQLRTEFLDRLRCQLILLPSGQSMQGGLFEPAGSLTFGKLLYGGVTRYRILPSSSGGGDGTSPPRPPRRAGERRERKTSKYEHIPSWVQYGGSERRYDAVDMGPAMVLEWSLLPKIQAGIAGVNGDDAGEDHDMGKKVRGDMMLRRLAWSPQNMFRYVNDDAESGPGQDGEVDGEATSLDLSTPMTLQGKDRNDAFATDFRSRVGGLGPQIDSIVRRVLDGRVIRPAEVDGSGNLLSYEEAKESMAADDDDDGLSLDDTSKQLSLAALEAEELALLGLTPVKGLLLYGPPGCGKTALAREIARALRARSPKIVSVSRAQHVHAFYMVCLLMIRLFFSLRRPSFLTAGSVAQRDWFGSCFTMRRQSLHHYAEAELASVNGDPSRSALHVIVIDEIDAVFRKRSSAEDSGEATRSSTVNQILAKLDGVEAIPNVLLIGMTNRRELLDEALLRPGRLEVQIEIPLPNRDGRREILQIHFGALRDRGRLSRPLCAAIDGTYDGDISDNTSIETGAALPTKGRKRRALKQAIGYLSQGKKSVFDLADDSVTGGFSGADLEGLVRCAGSIALSRARKEGAGVESLIITLDDVEQALDEVKV